MTSVSQLSEKLSRGAEVASVLTQALPHVGKFKGATMVVKVGGSALDDEAAAEEFAMDVALIHAVGIRLVVVHGGGPQITSMMERLGKKAVFKNGHRETDSEALDIARMVLLGRINRDVVNRINKHGSIALGVSGEDLNLLIAEQRDPGLGFVGDVKSVNTGLISRLLDDGLVPVIATIGSDGAGQAFNVNADSGAAAIAAELGARKIIYVTDVDGLYADPDDPSTLISRTTCTGLKEAVVTGSVGAGMIPKIEGCLQALAGGVRSAHILGGETAHPLLVEVFTDDGIGTMVSGDEDL